jgi:hypothetical protein
MVQQRKPELHDNGPKRVTTPYAVVANSELDKGFRLEPWHGEETHNGAPKRDTTP